MNGIKKCENCGEQFSRKPKESDLQWSNRGFCSSKCSNGGKELEPLHLRFWRNVVRRLDSECWLWIGPIDGYGYGRISQGGRSLVKHLKAHRLSYEMHNGPIEAGLGVLHKCDTPACVNPSHLYAGTQRDNAADMVKRSRLNPISQQNLRPGASGYRGAGPLSKREVV